MECFENTLIWTMTIYLQIGFFSCTKQMQKIITISTNKQIPDTQNLRNITEPNLNYGTNLCQKKDGIYWTKKLTETKTEPKSDNLYTLKHIVNSKVTY